MKAFDLIRKSYVDLLHCDMYVYRHNKTKAEVVYIDSKDIEKVFTIQFRTIPKSDNGICHILEHSVLGGSRKYNVKEPFVDLIKASMNTYLNAMTFSDKTVYPVATTNDKELLNLMDVYLDAVFFPNIYKDEFILAQEGWHYEIDSKDNLFINGVVYNEMKGVYSQPESVLYQTIFKELFDNVYSIESGGHPNSIPSLTQEEFTSFHRRYYHPTNSVSYLYGNLDIEKALDKLDEYFSEFDLGEKAEEVLPTSPFKSPKKVYCPYAVTQKEKDQTLLGIGISQGSFKNTEENVALKILSGILFSMPSSPIKNMLLDSGLVHDISAYFDDSLVQPVTSIFGRGLEEDNVDVIIESIFFELERLADEGLDRDLVEAAINQNLFELKEGSPQFGMSKGMMYGLDIIGNMDRGVMPEDRLNVLEHLSNIQSKLDQGYLESLIRKYYIDNKYRVYVALTPDEKLLKKEKESFEKEMNSIKASLSENDIKSIRDKLELLRKKQTTPDKKEDIESIPKISVEDIDRTLECVSYNEVAQNHNRYRVVNVEGEKNGVSYLDISFRQNKIDIEDVCDLSLLSYLLGDLSTEDRSYLSLSNDVLKYIGDFSIEPVLYKNKQDTYLFTEVKLKFLDENYKKALDIFEESITKTVFKEDDRLLALINMIAVNLEMKFLDRGNKVAENRVKSYFDKKAYVEEFISGIEFYRYIKDLADNFDSKKECLKLRLEKLCKLVFNIDDAIILYMGDKNSILDYALEKLQNMDKINSEYIGEDLAKDDTLEFCEYNKKEGLLIPSEVNYVAKGYNFIKLGYDFSGSLLVARQLIETDYLWEKLRVIGGAYGALMSVSIDGDVVFSSYRDPNVKSTLDSYNGVTDYISNLTIDEKELKRYIVGTVSSIVRPMSNDMRLNFVMKDLLEGNFFDKRQKVFTDILDMDMDTLKSTSKIFKSVLDKDFYCALGSKKIEDSGVDFKVERFL